MSQAQILLLGAIAGSTILLGLPVGRLRSTSLELKAALSGVATGILIFLLIETVEHGIHPVEEAVEEAKWGTFASMGAIFTGCFAVGLLSLVYYDRWTRRQRERAMLGPGAASAAEFEANWATGLSAARWLAVLIATGIGLHNFSEGLAIGQSGAAGEMSLALTLIIGFGLHNATEGFGIVAPLSGERDRPSWKFLGLLGLIGGLPTFLGTVIGQSFVSEEVSVAFLALAAGSILFVVIELMAVNRSIGTKMVVAWAILAGILLGFGTEFVIEAA